MPLEVVLLSGLAEINPPHVAGMGIVSVSSHSNADSCLLDVTVYYHLLMQNLFFVVAVLMNEERTC